MQLGIKVVPGASSNAIAGWLGNELKIRVVEAPEKGKANKAVIKMLAKVLGIDNNEISIVRGMTSSHKRVEISTLSEEEVRQRLSR